METLGLALQVLISLGAVLALVWWFHRVLTRGTRAAGTEPLVRVVTRQAISPKASVVVVDTGGRRFLLGVTEASVNVLHSAETETGAETEADADAGTVDLPPASFGSVLDAAAASNRPAQTQAQSPAQAQSSAKTQSPAKAPEQVTRRRAAGPAHAAKNSQAQPESRLAGSVLSPSTWQQAAAFVRGGRNG